MSAFYRVRVKVSAPTYKTQFIDGLFVANDIVDDVAAAKEYIVKRTQRQLDKNNPSNVRCEVVIFRRSNGGFIIYENSENLEDSK